MDTVDYSNKTKIYHALTTVVLMVAIMFTAIVGYDADPQIPLVFGCMIAGIVSVWIGYSWEDILDGMIKGITNALEAVLILLLIGMLVGSWIASGTVPTMIYYGLNIVSPGIFLPATMLICVIVAFAIGAWATVGTIGLAFMGIGIALQIPAPVVAGAVVSGSYMGDNISPLSDATNLSSAVVNGNVFAIVKTTAPKSLTAAVLTLGIFAVTGRQYASGDAAAVKESISPILDNLQAQFSITPLALIPLVIMIVCILFKLPAIASMLTGGVVGMIVAVLLQKCEIGDIITYAYSGFVSETGNETIDNLLTAGGMSGMLYSISIIIIAMAFGGIMKKTGQMEAIVKPIISKIRSGGMMNLVTVITCIFMNIILPDQYLGISMPGQMYADEYDRKGISRIRLGSTLLGGGAVTSPLVPWNTCGIYCMTILGVSPLAYSTHAFYCILVPIVTILFGFFAGKKNR